MKEFVCFDCNKTFPINEKGRWESCIYCDELRQEYREQDMRDKPVYLGERDED